MIHEFKREYLTLPLKDYTLTFDDGRVSPFTFWGELSQIPTEKIFFVITSAFNRGFEGKPPSEYLGLGNVRYLMGQPNTFIGGHSHYHSRISHMKNLKERVNHLKRDTELMMEWFNVHLNHKPTKFCFPYNEEDDLYRAILKLNGFSEIYGKSRIDIDKLFP